MHLEASRPDFYAVVGHFLADEIPMDGACTRDPAPERRHLQPTWDLDTENLALIAQTR